jgi:uncharacterized protein YndB with AHSA1/START domain
MSGGPIEPIRCSVGVSVPPKSAFDIFVDDVGRWWPLPYTWGEDQFENACIEPRAGGEWFETALDGSKAEWGEVRAFEPGHSLILSFNVSPERKPEPPERQSEVAIRFLPATGGTRVELEHRNLERHGAGAERLRHGMASRQGWPLILASFARETRHSGRNRSPNQIPLDSVDSRRAKQRRIRQAED